MYKDIIEELKTHGVHTIILYGSRARGDFTSSSDIDMLGFRDEGEEERIARWDEAYRCYLDIFIEPVQAFNDAYLRLFGGKILLDKDDFGKQLLAEVNRVMQKPFQLSKNEWQSRVIWYKKMIERAKKQDIEGLYRHQWVLHTLIEDFFAFRGMHYLGPKQGFQYLKKHHPEIYLTYEKALLSPNHVEILKALVDMIVL